LGEQGGSSEEEDEFEDPDDADGGGGGREGSGGWVRGGEFREALMLAKICGFGNRVVSQGKEGKLESGELRWKDVLNSLVSFFHAYQPFGSWKATALLIKRWN
jgi:hypothetical protein